MDFEALAQSGAGSVNQGTSYSKDGFTLNDTSAFGLFSSWELDNPNFAGSTGLFNSPFDTETELVKDDGEAFRLVSIDLAPLLYSERAAPMSVTFAGYRDGIPVALDIFTTPAAQPFATYTLDSAFENVDRVAWIQQDNAGDFHQFDNIVLADPVLAPCPGDANSDLVVDFGDVTAVLGNWLNDYTPGTGLGDADGNGVVNFSDVTAVLGNWLAVCP